MDAHINKIDQKLKDFENKVSNIFSSEMLKNMIVFKIGSEQINRIHVEMEGNMDSYISLFEDSLLTEIGEKNKEHYYYRLNEMMGKK